MKAKLWPSHRSLSWTKPKHKSRSSMHSRDLNPLLYQLQFCRFCHEQESCLFPKWQRLLVTSEVTPVLCVEARHSHGQGSWLADAGGPEPALLSSAASRLWAPWVMAVPHFCHSKFDKAISLYAMQIYPKWLQGRLVSLSPAADGKVLKSTREPNASGWCLWASGTVKLLRVVVTHSLSVHQLITAGRTVNGSVQAPCHSFWCVARLRADVHAEPGIIYILIHIYHWLTDWLSYACSTGQLRGHNATQ